MEKTEALPNKHLSREQAIEQLWLWPSWTDPSEKWIRKTLIRTGSAGPRDTVTTQSLTITDSSVPQHERPFLALLRRVARIAGADVDVRKFTALCGTGTISKRYAFVTLPYDDSANERQADDRPWRQKIAVRLDCENRNVRYMLEGGEDRLGTAGKS